jgi:hypothetical protein
MAILKILSFSLLFFSEISELKTLQTELQGAWQSDDGVTVIFAGNYFSMAGFKEKEFLFTSGGSWKINANSIEMFTEFDTRNPESVGTTQALSIKINDAKMDINGISYTRIDDGTPGKFYGAWLFSNRVVDGKPGTPRSGDDPRKTMKILSGTRFQWIAYNVQTKEFFGTGGGTYTTINGKYTEKIDFFSRDSSRVGAALEFDFRIDGANWHHHGLNSRGEPLYEIWTSRK